MPQAKKPPPEPELEEDTPPEPDPEPDEPVISGQAGSTSEAGTLPSAPQAPRAQFAHRVTEYGDVIQGRTDDDALTNQFARIVEGPLAGRYVVVQDTIELGDDGYPTRVMVRSRDDRDELLVVTYSHLRPAPSGGR